jgi:UDP-glucose 4-epimerase
VTITTAEMTRFLLSLDNAVDTIFAAVREGLPGETYVPRVPSALVINLAKALIDGRAMEMRNTGIRPGEKVHEILISEEEAHRSVTRDAHYVILPMLPELRNERSGSPCLSREYSSADNLMTLEETASMLRKQGLMLENVRDEIAEVLR